MKSIPFLELNKDDRENTILAKEISKNGYDPYGQFYVGCVILGGNGKQYNGCNIATPSYIGICAERSALAQMVTDGCYKIEKVYLYCSSDHIDVNVNSGPCGLCRTLIYEFAELQDNNPEVIITNSKLEKTLITDINELYPKGVGPILANGKVKKYTDRKSFKEQAEHLFNDVS